MNTGGTGCRNPSELRYLWTPDLDPLFWRDGRAGVASGWYGHVPFAHWIVAAVRPNTLVELGTQNGVSYSAFCEAVVRNGLDTRCFAVDTWKGDDQAGHYGEEVYSDLRHFHDERYGAFSELLRCTFDDALAHIPDASVDLLHIDGFHRYEAVRHDFESWQPKLSNSAVVLFHDTNVRESDFGVWRLWEELSSQFPSFEFLHGHGLGILALGHSISAQVDALCSLHDPACVHAIRERFSALGERWIFLDQRRQLEELRAGEIASHDARIRSLETEIAQLRSELACRAGVEEQLRIRAAHRAREARAEAARAIAEVEQARGGIARRTQVDVALQLARPTAVVEASKFVILERLRQELVQFLARGDRLSFPKTDAPDVSVIVVLFNQEHFTLQCLRAVRLQSRVNMEIILVDNNSSDETSQLLAGVDNVLVLRNRENVGFLRGVNQGAAKAKGRAILLLNSDAFMRENALAIALETLDSDSGIGAVGGRLVLPSGELQEAGSIVWSDGSALGYGRGLPPETGEVMFRRDVDFCSGAFLLTSRALFEQLGGLDPFYAPAYYEETDYCLRLWQAGFRVVYEPRVVIDHYEFGSQTGNGDAIELQLRNRKHLRLRHAGTLRLQHLPPSEGHVLYARDHARSRRRLLVIENEVPFRALGSGYPRMGAILNEAVAEGWFVTLYPLHSKEIDWKAVRAELSPQIEVCNGRCVSGLAGFLHERQGYYDVFLVSRPDNMALFRETVRPSPHVVAGARLVYDAEALFASRTILQAELEGRPMSREEADALINQELELTFGVDSIVTVTASEAQVFQERAAPPVYIVGHPAPVMRTTPGFTAREGFLFVGRLLEKNAPNFEGLRWFIHSVWPRIRAALGEVTLTVAGALHPEPTELMASGVVLRGRVEDLEPVYDQARVFVAPIRFAAGVPIKILDAGSAGLPTVGTKLMAKLLGWGSGVEMEACDDPVKMANAAISLYSNESRWEGVRSAALRRLSMEHSEAAFQRELRRLLDGAEPSASSVNQPEDKVEAHGPPS
jgi:O-antigen biosynthesis protein